MQPGRDQRPQHTKWWLFHLPLCTCISAGGIVTLTQAYQKQRAAPFLSFVFFQSSIYPFCDGASSSKAWQRRRYRCARLMPVEYVWDRALVRPARYSRTSLAFHTHLSVYPFSRMAKCWNLWMNTAQQLSRIPFIRWWTLRRHLDHTSSLFNQECDAAKKFGQNYTQLSFFCIMNVITYDWSCAVGLLTN